MGKNNYNKAKYYIPTILMTIIAAALRFYSLTNYVDSANGKFESVEIHIANIIVAAIGILIAARCFTAKFATFSVKLPEKSAWFTVIMFLCAFGSALNALACYYEYLAGTSVFAPIMALFSLIATVMFVILAFKQGGAKPAMVYVLSIAPFAYCVLKLILIFNIYSKNITLHPYRYEILGIAALLLFLIYFVKSIYEKGSARIAMIFSQISFFFLCTYAVPRIVGEYMPYAIFNEGANIYYVYADLILGIATLLLSKYISINKAGKH